MAGREHLRALVDSLPKGAVESAQTYLKAIQTWPPRIPGLLPSTTAVDICHASIAVLPSPDFGSKRR